MVKNDHLCNECRTGSVSRIATAAMSTKLIDITKQLTSFLDTSASSIVLKETNGISGISIIEAHVQKLRVETDRSGRFVLAARTGSDFNCINIVNVAVAERNRRRGLFTDFLELLEGFDYGSCPGNGSDFHVRVGNVMNPVLDEFLPKKGYSRIRSGNDSHFSYLKIVRMNREGERPSTVAGPELMPLRDETCPVLPKHADA